MTLLTDELQYPNGIVFSPDEETLYLSDTGDQTIRAYDVMPEGDLGDGRELADLAMAGSTGVVDGMAVDAEGHLYAV